MSFKIERGLFTSEFTDCHAILGVPVDADVASIRKRYLKIARVLHPDSLTSAQESDRQRASEFLSKLVNPAYEKLSQEKNYAEYCMILKLKGKQALKQSATVILTSDPARTLTSAPDFEKTYRDGLAQLADQLYQSLDDTLDLIGQISELNLVYLMRRESPGTARVVQPGRSPGTGSPSQVSQSAPRAVPTREDLAAASLRRAEEYESKQDYAKAILELREAIQMDPKNSKLHTRLGGIYIKAKQLTMAKIHFNQALKLDPQDAAATEGLRQVDPQARQSTVSAKKPASQDNKSGGGFFGMFGGKKKS